MDKINYVCVCVDEYEGSFVGTMEQIVEWQLEENIPVLRCRYYKLGDEVTLKDIDWR